MNIAIIGTDESANKIIYILKENYKDINFISFTQEEAKDFSHIIKKLPNDIDGIMATGIGVYHQLISNFSFLCPISYFKRGNIGLIKSFLDCDRDGNSLKDSSISIDIIDNDILEEVIDELDIKINRIFHFESDIKKEEDYYLKQHLDLYYKGKINYIFTAFGYVYNLLKKIGLPVYRIQASSIDIKEGFKYFLNEIRCSKADEKALLIHKINIENGNDVSSFISDYAKQIEGFMLKNNSTYMIISNKGYYDDELCLSRARKLIDYINEKDSSSNIKIGLGTGATVYKAIENCDFALKNCTNNSHIVLYNGKIQKNFNKNTTTLNYLSDKDITYIANKTGLSSSHIRDIDIAVKSLNRNKFTSNELANILGLTNRSANRIAKTLVEFGYAEYMENIKSKIGRPKNTIKMKLETLE